MIRKAKRHYFLVRSSFSKIIDKGKEYQFCLLLIYYFIFPRASVLSQSGDQYKMINTCTVTIFVPFKPLQTMENSASGPIFKPRNRV